MSLGRYKIDKVTLIPCRFGLALKIRDVRLFVKLRKLLRALYFSRQLIISLTFFNSRKLFTISASLKQSKHSTS